MRPSLGGSIPLSRLKKVVLPAPFGPMIVRTPPAGISSETSFTAVKPEKRRVSPSVLKTYSTLLHRPRHRSGLVDRRQLFVQLALDPCPAREQPAHRLGDAVLADVVDQAHDAARPDPH